MFNTAIQMEEVALKEYSATKEMFGRAACCFYLGCIHERRGDLAVAAQYLAEARMGFSELGVHPDKFEAQATAARALLALGRQEEAQLLTAEAWHYLREQGTEGLSSPSWSYLCILDVVAAIETPGISARGD